MRLTTEQKKLNLLRTQIARAAARVASAEIGLRIAKCEQEMLQAKMDAALGTKKEAANKVTLYLTSVGLEKIQTIKAIREVTGLALKEAKDITDRANFIQSDENKIGLFHPEDAERVRMMLHSLGAATTSSGDVS